MSNPEQGGSVPEERKVVPASEYDALSEAFRDYVKVTMFGGDVAGEIADRLIGDGYSDEDVDFIARAVEYGSAALKGDD